MDIQRIVVCDHDVDRIAAIEKNVRAALRACGMRARVDSLCEPPCLARKNLKGRLPALEVDEELWSLTPGKEISTQDCIRLFTALRERE